MRIGYICGYDDLGCGESEARIRWTYLLEKRGHNVIPLNRFCRTFDSNEHADNLNLDLVITAQVIEQLDIVYPNVPSCFFFWAPSSFFIDSMRRDYLKYMGKYDFIVGGYESKNPIAALALNPYFHYQQLLPAMASVPVDFVIPCEEKQNLKLFYVGMLKRYGKLLAELEKQNLIDIYGPKHAFGISPWADFKSYRGSIPFDGKTIIQKMHDAGIVLALHSKSHNREGFVSNRIFEAAAAGAIIIADDNQFIRKYFGDSVYYLDIFAPLAEQEKRLSSILVEIFHHKTQAFEKAKRAQKIFLEKLSLDNQVDAFLEFIANTKKVRQYNKAVDCICLIESEDDFYHIQNELQKQLFPKFHLILVTKDEVFSKIENKISFDYSYCPQDGDDFSNEIVTALKGDFFMMLNGQSVMHHNHILKAVQLLSLNHHDFVYSGCYEKTMDCHQISYYKTTNFRPYNFRSLFSDFAMGNNDGRNIRQFLALYPGCCFVFNRNVITSDYEMSNLPIRAVHLYLCLKSLFSNERKHAFMYTISAGKIPTDIPHETFLYDREGNSKNELLEKIKTNLVFLIDTGSQCFISDSFKKHVYTILLLYLRIKRLFSISRKKKYKLLIKQLKQEMKG